MANKSKKPKRPRGGGRTPKAEEMTIRGRDAVVEWQGRPPIRSGAPRQIHARRPTPPVPKGQPVADADASPPVDIEDGNHHK